MIQYNLILCFQIGFFKRKKHSAVQRFKQESLYKRKSRMSMRSMKGDQQYNALSDTETTGKTDWGLPSQ